MKNLISSKITFLFLFLFSISSFGQTDSYRIAELYTTDDGLSHNFITSLEKFKMGAMLIGTHNGLLIYDGYDFELVNSDSTSQPQLNTNVINSIAIDSALNVWVASDNGINKAHLFNQENERIFNLGNKKYPALKTQYDSKSTLTSASNGEIWMINNGIICRMIDGEIKQYFPEKYNEVLKIVSDDQNNMYALGKDFIFGFSLLGEMLFEINQIESPTYGLLKRGDISNLFRTKDGEIIMEDFNNNRFFKIISSGEIIDLNPKNHWIPKLFKEIDQQISKYNIKSIKKFDILETDQNLIWVATNFGLLKILVDHHYFETIPELEGINCWKLIEGNNGLIYGGTLSPNNFFAYNPINKNFKWINNNQDAADMVSLNQDSIIVVGANKEVRIFSESNQAVVSMVKNPNGVDLESVFYDGDSMLWFGAQKGLFQSKISNPLKISKWISPEGDIVSENLVRDICPIGDSTFLLASNNGIILFHKTKGTQLVLQEKSPANQRILNNIVGQFIKDKDGNVWVATDGGLNFLDMKTMELTKSFKKEDGLPSSIIYNMVMEGDSVLWLGTANGLSRFDLEKESFFNFYKKEGIADNEFNTNSWVRGKGGKIFLGGIRGVTIINPKKIDANKYLGFHFIQRYYKYNSSTGKIKQFRYNPRKIEPIQVKPFESVIELHLVNGDFNSPNKNTFSYLLEGYDQEWIPMSTLPIVRFSNLEAGEYVFKLKSANSNGVPNEYIFEVPIIVEEYFYKSKWFLILIVSLLLISVFAIIQYRFYLYQKKIQLRNKLARDLHDEMSNSFNNIRIIAKESNPDDINKTKADMYHIKNMSSEAIELVEDVIWSLNRENRNVGDMIMKMEDFLDDVLKSKNIPYTFEKIDINEDGELSYLLRRNLLLIFKEAITNTIKHSKPLHVHILIQSQPRIIYFQVTNVFDELVKAEYSTGLGIPGMRQRAEFINATIETKKLKNQFDLIMKIKKVKKLSLLKK